jgi:hypothetical protein
MRINYFGYFIVNNNTGIKHLIDIRPFLANFCSIDSPVFKNKFNYMDEKLFLFQQPSDMFLFLMTRSNEIIKKINIANLNLGEIYTLLGQNEHLGFASYTIIKENHLCFASTVLAPRWNIFADFINQIFKSIGLGEFELWLEPLLYQATKDEVLSMDFIGKTSFEIQRENSLWGDLMGHFTTDAEDAIDVDSFEVIIKPRKNKNIKTAVGKVINKISDDGLHKMIIRAKTETQSHLSDLYIVGKGAICDSIDSKNESRICSLIAQRMATNAVLSRKVGDFSNDERFEKIRPESLAVYSDFDTWTNFISNLQGAN